ncbi:hypothetical protein MBOU_05230 [Mycobacterium bourgelatii]|uniref:Uncharacterized protein n=1 Tax=Mycobacterium bourgelatii TaxID=1273442 RepID=A0A7I9YIH9_MYCBU|nr:hypothetical protein MBOU_05230 [Mycobacterium bourgelatii]
MDTGVPEFVALPEQWLASIDGQRVGEAIAEIQACGMAATFTEIRISQTSQASLALGYRLDNELAFLEELVKASADDWVTLGI